MTCTVGPSGREPQCAAALGRTPCARRRSLSLAAARAVRAGAPRGPLARRQITSASSCGRRSAYGPAICSCSHKSEKSRCVDSIPAGVAAGSIHMTARILACMALGVTLTVTGHLSDLDIFKLDFDRPKRRRRQRCRRAANQQRSGGGGRGYLLPDACGCWCVGRSGAGRCSEGTRDLARIARGIPFTALAMEEQAGVRRDRLQVVPTLLRTCWLRSQHVRQQCGEVQHRGEGQRRQCGPQCMMARHIGYRVSRPHRGRSAAVPWLAERARDSASRPASWLISSGYSISRQEAVCTMLTLKINKYFRLVCAPFQSRQCE
jgi:hypothetical protein